MLRRWGRIDWSIVAHALSASEYTLRARWYCFIRPQEFRFLPTSQSDTIDTAYTAKDSSAGTLNPSPSISVVNITNPVMRSLVFDMVNTVSITARLDSTTLNTIQHNIHKTLANGLLVQRTIAMEKMIALRDECIAVIIASVLAWNAGSSTAASLTDLWESISSKLDHKWPGKSLFAWWIKLCTLNRKSQLIVVPVVIPITAAFLVSKFSQLFTVQIDPTDELLQFLKDTPLAKERWCELLSHRPVKVYALLRAQHKKEENESLPQNQQVEECVKEMISALEFTERVDGYLALHTIESKQTQQIREDSTTCSAVAVVLRGIVSSVVKRSYPESVQVLKICNKYKRAVSAGLHSSQLPTLKRRPSLNVVRKALLLCVRYATKTTANVNWTVLALLLHRTEDELSVLWAEVQNIVCTFRAGRWYMLNTLDEQLDLL